MTSLSGSSQRWALFGVKDDLGDLEWGRQNRPDHRVHIFASQKDG